MRLSVVWDESNDSPMSGSATFATDRFRFATAATRIRERRTRFARAGASFVSGSPVAATERP